VESCVLMEKRIPSYLNSDLDMREILAPRYGNPPCAAGAGGGEDAAGRAGGWDGAGGLPCGFIFPFLADGNGELGML